MYELRFWTYDEMDREVACLLSTYDTEDEANDMVDTFVELYMASATDEETRWMDEEYARGRFCIMEHKPVVLPHGLGKEDLVKVLVEKHHENFSTIPIFHPEDTLFYGKGG